MMDSEFKMIPVEDLVDPPLVLRDVDQRSVEYLELRDSLAKLGLLNSICVRPSIRFPGKYEVIDGRHRKAVAREIDLIELPCLVKYGMSDKDVMALQITANAVRLSTRPAEYSRQIRRILREDTGMTQAELCRYLNKNPQWVRKMLSMGRLSHIREYRDAMDRGELSLEAAYWLSRLPTRFWADYALDAKVLPLKEFKALIMATLRQYRAQISVGTLTEQLLHIEPRPYMRTLTDLLEELESRQVGALTVATLQPTPLDTWFLAIQWVIHMDAESADRQRMKILRRLQKRAVKRSDQSKDK